MQGFENKYFKGEQKGHQFFLKLLTSCRRVANHDKLSERQGVNYHFYFDSLNFNKARIVQIWRLALKRILKFLARFDDEGHHTGLTDL